ncbi:DUF2254 domain-containing protein [Salininema proteolyticum]|uniref:DUF2254 domain-containing protein n=1 Tax=Salininema proteolyticum TaxID=1607685 RepID=A0ABV8TZ14_9ACTN
MKVIPAYRHRRLSTMREHLRNSFVVLPGLAIVASAALAVAAWWADDLLSRLFREASLEPLLTDLAVLTRPASAMVNTVSSAMLTFVGVVFSISLVALQMAANSFSQRVLLLYVRSRITKATLSIFLGTFVYSMLISLEFADYQEGSELTTVPFFGSLTAILLVFASLFLFIIYVDSTISLLRLSEVVDVISRDTLKTMRYLSRTSRGGELAPGLPEPEHEPLVLTHDGKSGALQDVDIVRLVRYARRHGVLIRLIPRPGDFITTGTPIARVTGGDFRPHLLAKCLSVGADRSLYQDVAFGLRQLADIACKALSPGVNDPTTAVQVIDRLQELLGHLCHAPFEQTAFSDKKGEIRLLTRHSTWTSLVDLAFTEIRSYGADSPQVTRRLSAALTDLAGIVPDDRRDPLHRHLDQLRADVAAAVPNPADARFALEPDRQGIG